MAYPTDILALKMLSDYSTFYGPKERVRDSVARVFPHWNKTHRYMGTVMAISVVVVTFSSFQND